MFPERVRSELAAALAPAFLAGEWEAAAILSRGRRVFGRRRPPWLPALVNEVLASYHRPPLDRPRELTAFVAVELDRMRERTGYWPPPPIHRRFAFTPSMARVRWPVPALATEGDLAAFLELEAGDLGWFADRRGLERSVTAQKLRHYRYSWLARPNGSPRVIEAPKPRLKALQRRVLAEILVAIPPHEAVHGFRRGRSALTHAATHTGRLVVLRFDLEDFFASIEAARIYGMFRSAGYPEAVAHALTALCTNSVPVDEWAAVPRPRDLRHIVAHHRCGLRLAVPHLPQGAPSSPALANLCAFGLDRRLHALAESVGASYSRYADDIAFSGGNRLLRRADGIARLVERIADEEGFRVNRDKTRLMPRAGRQQLCGVVVNEKPNLSRREFDRLKAILHNSARNGPAAENRAGLPDFRAHLLGRISWAESLNPERGRRLRRVFEQIDWAG